MSQLPDHNLFGAFTRDGQRRWRNAHAVGNHRYRKMPLLLRISFPLHKLKFTMCFDHIKFLHNINIQIFVTKRVGEEHQLGMYPIPLWSYLQSVPALGQSPRFELQFGCTYKDVLFYRTFTVGILSLRGIRSGSTHGKKAVRAHSTGQSTPVFGCVPRGCFQGSTPCGAK